MRAVIPSIRPVHSPVAHTAKAPDQHSDLVLGLLNRSRDLSRRHRRLLNEVPKRQESCMHRIGIGVKGRQLVGNRVDIGTITDRKRNKSSILPLRSNPRGCSYTNISLSVLHNHLKPLSPHKALKSLATSLRKITSHRPCHSQASSLSSCLAVIP